MLNNSPIQSDELGRIVLTPNRIIHGGDVYLLEELKEADSLSKMVKKSELLKKLYGRGGTSTTERHDVTKTAPFHFEIGKVVLLVADSKNRHE